MTYCEWQSILISKKKPYHFGVGVKSQKWCAQGSPKTLQTGWPVLLGQIVSFFSVNDNDHQTIPPRHKWTVELPVCVYSQLVSHFVESETFMLSSLAWLKTLNHFHSNANFCYSVQKRPSNRPTPRNSALTHHLLTTNQHQ